jgi:4-hydroxy-tetrahydrodipicolinate synthase
MFVDPSPACVKYAASLLGLCHNELRSPMMPATETARGKVRDAMIAAGLL